MSTLSNNIKSALLTVLAGAVLTACNDFANLEDNFPAGKKIKIAAEIEETVSTKTCIDPYPYSGGVTGLLWSPKDSIGVFSKDGSENSRFVNNSLSNVKNAEFEGVMGSEPEYAYFPYTTANDGRTADRLQGTVHTTQGYSSNRRVLSDDWKYGSRRRDKETENGEDANSYSFSMKQLFSLAKVTVSATGTEFTDQVLHSIRLRVGSPEGVRRINGDFEFDARSGEYTMTGEAAKGESNVTTMEWLDTPVLTEGNSKTGYLTLIPDIHKGDTLVIRMDLADYSVEYKVKVKVDFQPGYMYELPLAMSSLAEKMSEDYGLTPKKTVLPTISSFKFLVSENSGKLLDNRLETSVSSSKYSSSFKRVSEHSATINGNTISLVIPYLYDFNLAPRFTAPEGAVISAGGMTIENGTTVVDWANTRNLSVTVNGLTRVYDVDIRNTGLPVVVINQSSSGDFSKVYSGGLNIGNTNIGGTLVNQFVDFMVRGKETEWVEDDQMTVYNPDGSVDMATTNCGIRLRGNSTQKLPKKPFAIKLTAKKSILGMPSHKRWCLLANWLDRSKIRNLTGFAVARMTTEAWKNEQIDEGITWTPSGCSVELVINGHHVGNYLLCEQIKIGSKRLNIKDCYEDLSLDGLDCSFKNCGFLVEFDVMQDETYKGITKRGITWQLKDDLLADGYSTQIGNKIQEIETAIKGGDFSKYSQLIDLPSFIDQWFVVELAMNREYTEPRSLYSYFNGGNDKLHAGPVWDFDRATFQNPSKADSLGSVRVKPYNKFLSSTSKVTNTGKYNENQQPCLWYPLLMDDAQFVNMVKDRWEVMYPYLMEVVYWIAAYGDANRLSWEYDSTMWPGTASALNAGYPSGFSDFAGDENLTTYEAVIQNFIECYTARLNGMNTLINNATESFEVNETTF